jgi:hypothetical protein
MVEMACLPVAEAQRTMSASTAKPSLGDSLAALNIGSLWLSGTMARIVPICILFARCTEVHNKMEASS